MSVELFPLEALVRISPKEATLNGERVKAGGLRVKTVWENNECATPGCPHVVTHVALCANSPGSVHKYHVNFYSVVGGVQRMMTHDHIHPRSKGGKHTAKNAQTMCYTCNQLKADK